MSASGVLLTCSGTAAMELALRAVGVLAGDEVLLSAYDYPGNFWAIERIGARPVLLDVEAEGWRIDSGGLELAMQKGAGYKALIVSHLHGQLQPVAQLRGWCDAQGLMLIEDTCQAVGATIADRPAGSFGHASIISFGGGKVLSAGRGGAMLTSDVKLAQRAKILAAGGSGPYALSELQAAAVNAQLPWLDENIAHCRYYFASINECLHSNENAGVQVPFANDLGGTAFYQAGFMVNSTSDLTTGDFTTGNLTTGVEAADRQSQLIAALRAHHLPAGGGFPGFHRRSTRRCRHAQPLVHVADVAARTVTIHHSAALEPTATAAQTAEILADPTKK